MYRVTEKSVSCGHPLSYSSTYPTRIPPTPLISLLIPLTLLISPTPHHTSCTPHHTSISSPHSLPSPSLYYPSYYSPIYTPHPIYTTHPYYIAIAIIHPD
ncbi:hypothetical protein [uncultured Duncaniella sp.]|uniref:hypothetical protein n=1 Tax=uncultured Duncaniella sp. TaxID=2768039 RepID=UPI0026499A73|nr:hypothetical protein [uncultured Duncaniella sp.]